MKLLQQIFFSIAFMSCLTFTSCNLIKTISNQEQKPKNRKVKFIPKSKDFQFQLTEKESMPFAEYDFGAEIYNGKIYAFLDTHRNAGEEGHNYGDVCVYDIANNSWSKVNVIPKSQPFTTSVISDGKIYLIGAYGFKDLIQVYNIQTNAWEENLKLPIGLYWTTAESFEGKIYIMGGYAEDFKTKGIRYLSNVQIFDTKTRIWSKGAEMPRKLQTPNSLQYKGDFYVWGINPKVMLKYNVSRNFWSSVEELQPYVKGSQEGIILNDKMIFISGQKESGKDSKAIKKIYSYDPVKKEYSESFNNLLFGRHYNYGVFEYQNKIYLLGGREDQDWEPMNNVIELKIK